MLDMETEEDLVKERIARRKKEEKKLLRYKRTIKSQLFSRHARSHASNSDDETDDDDDSGVYPPVPTYQNLSI